MKRLILVFAVSVLTSGCAMTYTLDGEKYSGEDAFLSASDRLYPSTRTQVVATQRLPAPVAKKTLTIGVPTIEAVRNGFKIPPVLLATPAQLAAGSALSKGARKEYEMFAATIRDVGIYESVKIVDTNGGHMQPSSQESVLYMFVTPGEANFQWYMNGGKAGLQTVNIDRGQPKFLGKANSFVNSVKGYALSE